MASQLPDLLREYRLKHRLSQQQLAAMLNTEQSYISRIERGERPGKASDLDFLRRVCEKLSIEPERLGLSSSAPTRGREPETIEAWQSVLALANNVRSHGDSEAAVRHLFPVVAALDHSPDSIHKGANNGQELLVRTKLALATALGDRLPLQDLQQPIRLLREASEAVDPDDRELRGHVLRVYGNELRKNGQLDSAATVLQSAAEIDPNSKTNGPLAIAAARVEAERANWRGFDRAITTARRALDSKAGAVALFNPLVVYEAQLRGLISHGDIRGVVRELESPISGRTTVAPQWRVIHSVTIAEAYLFTGDFDLGVEAINRALEMATELRLPQQIERVCKFLYKYRAKSGPLGDLLDAARRIRSKLPAFAF